MNSGQSKYEKEVQINITTIGIDLAENIFQIHGVDERSKVLVRKQLKLNDPL